MVTVLAGCREGIHHCCSQQSGVETAVHRHHSDRERGDRRRYGVSYNSVQYYIDEWMASEVLNSCWCRHYLTESEQTPSALGAGVLVSVEDEQVTAAGGWLVHWHPWAHDGLQI